jgi:hypothetical protein
MSELVHQLRLELHLKDADNKFLQTELEKSNELVSAKDSMLSMLTEGLKEVSSSLLPTPSSHHCSLPQVEVNQATLLGANEALSGELDVVHKAYEEVVSENEILKDEVRRLMKCLEAREKQFFEVTGRSVEAEEF